METVIQDAQDIVQRLARHQKGYVDATKNRLPVRIAVEVVFRDKYKAYDFEKYLKSGSGRAFAKKHLI